MILVTFKFFMMPIPAVFLFADRKDFPDPYSVGCWQGRACDYIISTVMVCDVFPEFLFILH